MRCSSPPALPCLMLLLLALCGSRAAAVPLAPCGHVALLAAAAGLSSGEAVISKDASGAEVQLAEEEGQEEAQEEGQQEDQKEGQEMDEEEGEEEGEENGEKNGEEEGEGEEESEDGGEEVPDAGKLMADLDKDKDGSLTFDELAPASENFTDEERDILRSAVKRADTDGDGKLNETEFPSLLEEEQPVHDPEQVMADLDKDKDGSVSFEELAPNAHNMSGGDLEDLKSSMKVADADGDGKISREEMPSLLEEFGRPEGPSETNSSAGSLAETNSSAGSSEDASAQSMMSDFDEDKDGFLSFGEIFPPGLSEKDNEELKGAMKKADADGDGKISAKEFPALLEVFRQAEADQQEKDDEDPVKFMAEFDKDKDGSLSFEEVVPHDSDLPSVDKEEFKSAMKKADADGDGKISKAEFPSLLQEFGEVDDEGEPEDEGEEQEDDEEAKDTKKEEKKA